MSYESYGTYQPSPEEQRRIEEERLRRLEEERQRAITEARRQASADEATRNAWVRDYETVVARHREAIARSERDHAVLLTSRGARPRRAEPAADVRARFTRVQALVGAIPESLYQSVLQPIERIRRLVHRLGTASGPTPADDEALADAERYLTMLPDVIERERAKRRQVKNVAATMTAELNMVARLAEAPDLRQRALDLLVRVKSRAAQVDASEMGKIVTESEALSEALRAEQRRNAVRDALVERITSTLTGLGFRVDPPPGAAVSPTTVHRRIAGPGGLSATASVHAGKVVSLHLDIGDVGAAAPPPAHVYAQQKMWCAAVDAVQQGFRDSGFAVSELRRSALPPPVDVPVEHDAAGTNGDDRSTGRVPQSRVRVVPPRG
jgi:hypothetical protein